MFDVLMPFDVWLVYSPNHGWVTMLNDYCLIILDCLILICQWFSLPSCRCTTSGDFWCSGIVTGRYSACGRELQAQFLPTRTGGLLHSSIFFGVAHMAYQKIAYVSQPFTTQIFWRWDVYCPISPVTRTWESHCWSLVQNLKQRLARLLHFLKRYL